MTADADIIQKRQQNVVAARNNERVLQARLNDAAILIDALFENLVFLDETGFNHYTTRNYGYSARGEPATLVVPTIRGRNKVRCAQFHLTG